MGKNIRKGKKIKNMNLFFIGVAFLVVGILMFLFAPQTFTLLGIVWKLKNIGVLLIILGIPVIVLSLLQE